MQRVLCVCVKDEKSWNIELKDTKNIYFLIRKVLKYWTKDTKNIYFLNRKVLKHWTKWNKKSIFNFFSYLWCGIWEYFILFFYFFIFCIECSSWQNLILSRIKFLLLYIYIYIDLLTSIYKIENLYQYAQREGHLQNWLDKFGA